MKLTLMNFAAGAGLGLAALMAIDQLVKAHKKNQMPHIANNAMLLSGCIITILLAGFLVFAFTNTLVPLFIFASLVSVAAGAVYAVRFKREKDANALWEEMLAEEEKQAGETADRDPANAAAWARLAQIKEKRGDLRGALELFSVACKLEPTRLNLERLEALREKAEAQPPEQER